MFGAEPTLCITSTTSCDPMSAVHHQHHHSTYKYNCHVMKIRIKYYGDILFIFFILSYVARPIAHTNSCSRRFSSFGMRCEATDDVIAEGVAIVVYFVFQFFFFHFTSLLFGRLLLPTCVCTRTWDALTRSLTVIFGWMRTWSSLLR